jgi:hypothetical protein
MEDKIRQLAWNIILEHNTISSLLSDTLGEDGQVSIDKLQKSRQEAMEFVARLLEQTMNNWKTI